MAAKAGCARPEFAGHSRQSASPRRCVCCGTIVLRLAKRHAGLLNDHPILVAHVARAEARPAYQRAFAARWAVNGPAA